MTLFKAALVLMTLGALAMPATAFAAGDGKNAESSHQGTDDNQGVSSDVTGPTCYSQDSAGNQTTIDCPQTQN